MKVNYRNCEIECYRDKTIEGDDILSYSIIDKTDGFEVCSGISWGNDTVREYINYLKADVDDYIEHPEEYRDIPNEHQSDENIEDVYEDDNVLYKITPKGIASVAMLQCGLINSIEDPRLEGFWTLFEAGMRNSGYIQEENNEQ